MQPTHFPLPQVVALPLCYPAMAMSVAPAATPAPFTTTVAAQILLLQQGMAAAAPAPMPLEAPRCPCCDGSCERDAREVLRGRGAAYGSAEALGKISVVCIGDSITSGVGASTAASTYPGHLQRLLGDGYVVTNLGACGAALQRCSDLPYRGRVQWQAAQMVRADIVVVMLGTNDARPANWNAPGQALQFEEDYRALVDSMCRSNGMDCI